MKVWSMKLSLFFMMVGVYVLCISTSAPATESLGAHGLIQCEMFLRDGRFNECVALASRIQNEDNPLNDELPLGICKIKAMIELEKYPEALAEIKQLQQLVKSKAGSVYEGEIHNLSGTLSLETRNYAEAEQYFNNAVKFARTTSNGQLLSKALNNFAILLLRQNRPQDALPLIKEGVSIAENPEYSNDAARLYITYANTLLDLGQPTSALRQIAIADEMHRKMPPSYYRAKGLLVIGDWYSQLDEEYPRESTGQGRQKAFIAYQNALETALMLNNLRITSYAAGNLGRIKELDSSYPDALKYTRMAMFYAQQGQYVDYLYLWQWQGARILKAQGSLDEAINLCRLAVETLQSIKCNLVQNEIRHFQKQVKPVYLDLADLLLAKASLQDNQQAGQETLAEVLKTIEFLRSDELRNYLRDSCAGVNRAELTSQRLADDHVAVIYYIAFRDRIVALLGTKSGFRRFTVSAPISEINASVKTFRELLRLNGNGYIQPSQKLYEWLIAPMDPYLKDVTTLVFVPDGSIRMIPMAALHDGKQFLIEKYSIALTQGLSITEGEGRLSYNDVDIFLGGISKAVNGFGEIPSVNQELDSIRQIYPGVILKDEAFTTSSINEQLKKTPYPVFHIASHGQFTGDFGNTFILAWDGKLTMDKLAEYVRMSQSRQRPLDLLTLSACSTAAGNEQASLGLAGVALKAGAKSAIASLWEVDDRDTADFFVSFYQLLKKEPTLSKAEALRKAQLLMLYDKDFHEPSTPIRGGDPTTKTSTPTGNTEPTDTPVSYSNPYYWAPFVLTGNWL